MKASENIQYMTHSADLVQPISSQTLTDTTPSDQISMVVSSNPISPGGKLMIAILTSVSQHLNMMQLIRLPSPLLHIQM